MRNAFRALGALSLLLPTIASAQVDQLGYTYVEGGFVNIDFDGAGDDSGVRIAGSFDFGEPLAAIGEYADVGDVSQLTGGLQFRVPLDRMMDFTAAGTLEHVDIGRDDDIGGGLRAGLRWLAISAAQNPGRLEIGAELRHLFGFDFDSATSLRGNALFRLVDNLDVHGAVQLGDDDRLELGLRYSLAARQGRRL